jgi:molybdopterin-binding protein
MKLSARNIFKGTVESVEEGIITAKVKIKVETPITVTAVITKEAVKDLELKRGDKAAAVIKATEIMILKE